MRQTNGQADCHRYSRDNERERDGETERHGEDRQRHMNKVRQQLGTLTDRKLDRHVVHSEAFT